MIGHPSPPFNREGARASQLGPISVPGGALPTCPAPAGGPDWGGTERWWGATPSAESHGPLHTTSFPLHPSLRTTAPLSASGGGKVDPRTTPSAFPTCQPTFENGASPGAPRSTLFRAFFASSWILVFVGSEVHHSNLCLPLCVAFLLVSLLLTGARSCWRRALCTSATYICNNPISKQGHIQRCNMSVLGTPVIPLPCCWAGWHSPKLMLLVPSCSVRIRPRAPNTHPGGTRVRSPASPHGRLVTHDPTFSHSFPSHEAMCHPSATWASWCWKQAGGQKGARTGSGTPPSYPLQTHFSTPFSF